MDQDPAEPSPVFPTEIFDLILKELAAIQNPIGTSILRMRDLQRCSLVCKAWVPLALSRLLHTVKVGDYYRWRTMYPPGAALAQLIIKKPHLVSYLRRIDYTIGSQGFAQHENRMRIFLHLPDIRTLSIQAATDNCFYERASTDSFGYRTLIEAYLSSSTLTCLIIGNVKNVPILAILSSPNLESLSLALSSLPDWPKIATGPLHFSSNLQHLKLSHVRNAHYDMILCLPHLRSLYVSGRIWGIESISLSETRPVPFRRLESLFIDQVTSPWVPHFFRDGLGRATQVFPRLRSLHFRPDGSFGSLDGEEISYLLGRTPVLDSFSLDVHAGEHLIKLANVHQYLVQNNASLSHLCLSWSTGLCVNNSAVKILSESLARIPQPVALQVLELKITMCKPYFNTLDNLVRRLTVLDHVIFKDSPNFPMIRDLSVHIFIQYRHHRRGDAVISSYERRNVRQRVKTAFKWLNRAERAVRLDVRVGVRIEYDDNVDYDSDGEPPDAFGMMGDGDLVFSDDELDEEDVDEPWREGRAG